MKVVKFIAAIILPQLAGVIGVLTGAGADSSWYQELVKPALNPPPWVFGPVWTSLYLLMGIALFLVWKRGLDKKNIRSAFWLFLVHLIVNAVWSVLFFTFENPFLALLDISVLWILIAVLIVKFWRISKVARWLLVPYLLWVSFATYLNFMIWTLN